MKLTKFCDINYTVLGTPNLCSVCLHSIWTDAKNILCYYLYVTCIGKQYS